MIHLEYDGSRYHGWQMQENARAVQAVVEEALETILREKVRLNFASRTDAGVHAFMQVIDIKTKSSIPCEKLFLGVNSLLPDDVVVTKVAEVEPGFDSRRSAKSKVYRYVILNRKEPTAIYRNRAWHVWEKLDVDLMKEGAGLLLGEHDFSSFRGSGCTSRHAVRKMLKASFTPVGPASEYLYFEIEGQAFLKHMVRNIVGTLVGLGLGKVTLDEFKDILAAKDRTRAGVTAPPQGLYLLEVKY